LKSADLAGHEADLLSKISMKVSATSCRFSFADFVLAHRVSLSVLGTGGYLRRCYRFKSPGGNIA
jgi:hypothetical protein